MIGKLIGLILMIIGFLTVWHWFLGDWVIRIFTEMGLI